MYHNYAPTVFNEIDEFDVKNRFTIAAGAHTWVDTDISGSDVPKDAIAVYLFIYPAATQGAGARKPGSAKTSFSAFTGNVVSSVLCGHSNLHIELLRWDADNTYILAGYLR